MKHSDGGLIYYVLDATRLALRVKIGHTHELGARLTALASDTAMRQRPIVLALEEGGTELETQRHEQFRDLWLMGEWFDYRDPLVSHMRELPNPIGWLIDRPHLWHFARSWQGFTGWTRQRAYAEEREELAPMDSEVPAFLPQPEAVVW